MQPSRIVKSAHRRAGSALSLKAFVVKHMHDADIGHACQKWLANKSSNLVEVSRAR